jgi:hypothetical protein
LRKQNAEEQEDPDRQQDDCFLPAGLFLVAGWIVSSQVRVRPIAAHPQ